MKTGVKLVGLAACAGMILAACGGSESASRVKNAALGKPAVMSNGSCDDGELIEGLDEDDCVVTIKVGKTTRKASLQVLNTDGDWDNVLSVIAKRGNAKFDVYATDDDGVWLDGLYTYRVFAPRSGKTPEFISADFDILFGTEMAVEDSSEMDSEEDAKDSGTPPAMQSAMDDIEKPATKFDDNCSKIFNKVDCELMFRPGKGPDFTTLGASKWVKMCSTLLKRPESDCETEFKYATQNTNKGMGNPQGGTMRPGAGLDPAKIIAACAAIGMTETDCRAAMQLGPIGAMQKFADKAEAFCQAYGAKSCADLMMQAVGGPAGMGGAMQPGAQPSQPGQPGQPGTMQPPTPGKG